VSLEAQNLLIKTLRWSDTQMTRFTNKNIRFLVYSDNNPV